MVNYQLTINGIVQGVGFRWGVHEHRPPAQGHWFCEEPPQRPGLHRGSRIKRPSPTIYRAGKGGAHSIRPGR